MKKTLIILTIFLLISSLSSAATWQQTLESNFDIVETFDQLQDWKGPHVKSGTNTVNLPKKLDNSSSIWEMYDYWDNNPSPVPYWIGDHGQANVWQGSKSLCLDYRSSTSGKGPARFGFSIGDKPSDGYPEEVYVFYMLKYNKEFFPINGTKIMSLGNYKTLLLSTGFRDIEDWGTVQEQLFLDSGDPGDPTFPIDYGINFNEISQGVMSGKLRINHIPFHSAPDGLSAVKVHPVFVNQNNNKDPNTNLNPFIFNNSWFGIEYHAVKSNPHGASNGYYEVWIYDKDGKEANYGTTPGFTTFADGQNFLNHSWNKFVWGGNRDKAAFSSASESHLYVDDIIVHDSRIGLDYFNLLSGQPICVNDKTMSCSTGQPGICGAGTQMCVNENWGACIQDNNPSTEDCTNTLDDDCDGGVDCSDSDCSSDQNCLSQPTTQTFYSTSGDGHVRKVASSWSSAHDAPAGDSTDNSNTKIYPMSSEWGQYGIHRVFLPIDTSSIPDDASITAATLYLYYSGFSSDMDNDGNDFLRVVQTAQANPNQLNISDYPNIGTTAGSNDAGIGNLVSGLNAFQLNAEGISWISKTGITKLGLREGHDILNDPIDIGNETLWAFYSSENTNNKPYLEITYTSSSGQNCTDGDGDNYGVGSGCLGTDCDDYNINVHQTITCTDYPTCGTYNLCALSCPAAPGEICGNGNDENCNGMADDTCPAGPLVAIDASIEHQAIVGFGASEHLLFPNTDNDFDLLFNDLGISILRMKLYSFTEDNESDLGNIAYNDNSDPDVIDWGGVNTFWIDYIGSKLPLKAKEKGLDYLMVDVNSPPSWMKQGGCLEYQCGMLLPQYYKEFAEFLAIWYFGLKNSLNVTIDYFSLVNEPNGGHNPTWEGVSLSGNEIRDLVIVVGKYFYDHNISARLIVPESVTLSGFSGLSNPSLQNSTSRQYLDALGTHTYDVGITNPDGTISGWGSAKNLASNYNKQLWMTERGDNQLYSWQEGFLFVQRIHNALYYGDVNAWIYHEAYEPTSWNNGGGGGLINEFGPAPKFYWLKNYYKYVRPGAIRVYTLSSDSDILVTAFNHKGNSNFTLVAVNRKATVETATFNITNLQGGLSSLNVFRTSETENATNLGAFQVSGNTFSYTLPKESITTFTSITSNQQCIDIDGDGINPISCGGNDCNDWDITTQACHPADKGVNPNNGCVEDMELTTFIAAWKAKGTAITMPVIMSAIKIWKGCN